MLEHQIHPFLYVFLNFLKAFKSQYPLLRASLLVRALPGEKPCYRFCIAKNSAGKVVSFWHYQISILIINYRLITAYLLLRVNLDKIMHARWDFDASSARTRRVSALDKHQNWSASALFCLNSRAQSKYAVVNLIHTRRKQTFVLLCDK